MKFVFNLPPREVRNFIAEFTEDVESKINLPVTLNTYGTQYYSHQDGRLDTTTAR